MPLIQEILRELLTDKAAAAADEYFHVTSIAREKRLCKKMKAEMAERAIEWYDNRDILLEQ